MIKKLDGKVSVDLIEYVHPDMTKVPYLYANLCHYDGLNENIVAYADMDGDKINGIYLKYYDCLHFYTKDEDSYPRDVLMDMIEKYKTHIVMLQDKVGMSIKAEMDEEYELERNHVFVYNMDMSKERKYRSVLATREWIPGVVDLMVNDVEYRHIYKRETLLPQMYERFDEGFSRFYVVIEDNKVVAVESSYGETDDIGLLGGLIVHDDWRRQGLAEDVMNHLSEVMIKEGKTVVGFINVINEKSLAFHEKIGAVAQAMYAKFIGKER